MRGTLRFRRRRRSATAPGVDFRRRAQIVLPEPRYVAQSAPDASAPSCGRPLQRFGMARGGAAGRGGRRGCSTLVRLPRSYAARYPHQLSGGEKQRVGIARALASPAGLPGVRRGGLRARRVGAGGGPEPAARPARRAGRGLLFISHDIGVIAHIADRIAVMYRGGIVEEGPAAAVLRPPFHPYTEALLSAVPIVGERGRGQAACGCRASPARSRRVPAAGSRRDARASSARSANEPPPWRDAGEGHRIACHIPLADLTGETVPARHAASTSAESRGDSR